MIITWDEFIACYISLKVCIYIKIIALVISKKMFNLTLIIIARDNV